MSESREIIRLAAKGDGVTADGQHVTRAAPGDTLLADGSLEHGPHHVEPPCRHFGTCGACQLQHCDEAALARFVSDRVVHAAAGQGLEAAHVAPPAMSPPRSRRRASLRAINGGGRPLIGFTSAGSHKVFDMQECHVLRPELFALLEPLRAYFALLKGKYAVTIELTAVDQGVDVNLSGFAPEGLEQTETLLDFCRDQSLARLTLDQGYGAESFWEPEPVTVTLGGYPVAFPPASFLQATEQGEHALVGAAREWLDGAGRIADLFAGLGTFALSLSKSAQILAAEADATAINALRLTANRARLQIDCAHRDLFRNPLRAEEMAELDAVLLDPPRAGAKAQVEQIAASGVERVVYISCNPSSWARDAVQLKEAGYTLQELRPVGQFRWSTHVELASFFTR
ncbi:class I SAM-dependent RNA methyltransferase [Aurantiacibacter poecillastricola]|uniref:class I SAM-dependent RNA methyltransferase n=1 Tax=Aurantiacibacter poecillastricola TaxID=3064385 RepID=UPI00273F44AD|nr:methyltransferase [Aurantiacibacter sp. 219JJ12-13]MDP5262172.1 methyltransferase [Aurantiacibacter sp. 219JJ12-13]